VITDFHLQGKMTGGDLLYAVRVRLHYSQEALPVLVMTGNESTQTQVEVFHAGANDFVIKPLIEEVLMARVRSLLLIKHQFDALRTQARDMERLAVTDALTGVHNRRHLVDEGQHFLQGAPDGWVTIVDLDHFKRINDTRGHLVGDQVLMSVGALLNQQFPDGLVARFGGEEFVVLLHGDKVPQRAERLRAEVARLQPAGVDVSLSLGLASTAEHPGKDLNALLGVADKALYGAKAAGRNQAFLCLADGTIRPVALPKV
jgi:two-component system, cell cycle response regulator